MTTLSTSNYRHAILPQRHLAVCVSLCFCLGQFALVFTALPVHADPVPIVQDQNDEWKLDPGGSFSISEHSLYLRRYVQLPMEGGAAPGVLGMRLAPGDDRLFVVSQGGGGRGNIFAIAADGSSASLFATPRAAGHRNLRDVVFHPQFDQVGTPGYGKLYTLQSVSKPADPTGLPYIGDSSFTNSDALLAEWGAVFDEAGKFIAVDTSSPREVLRIAEPRPDHPSGQGMFNPFAEPGDEDYGLLYFSHGDSFQFSEQSQNGGTGLGKVLRINPLQAGSNPYSVPSSNPFVGNPDYLDELYTIGHRNNHTLSFAEDDLGNGHILLGEIGANLAEEINLISQGGGNYGWAHREGTLIAPFDEGSEDVIYPVAQYGHNGTGPHAVAGGYVVNNGSELDGQFFFVDFPESGDTFTFAFDDALNATLTGDRANLNPVDPELVSIFFDDDDNPATASVATTMRDLIRNDPSYPGGNRLDVRFGLGHDGELYVLNKFNGWVYLVENSVFSPSADFNNDGNVDAADLAKWEEEFGRSNLADADGDGDSDGRDLIAWLRQFTGNSSNVGGSLTVPEAHTAALLLLEMVFGVACCRGRRRHR